MRNIVRYMMVAVALFTAVSCTQDEMFEPAQNDNTLQFVVDDFPGYTATRAIGTHDQGKTGWVNEDVINITFTSPKFGTQTGTLTYNGSKWQLKANFTQWIPGFAYVDGETPTITATYGEAGGESEYLEGICTLNGKTISISFASRPYSRLRIAGDVEQTYDVTFTGFTPAGKTEVVDTYTTTLIPDAKQNMYLYGKWNEGSTVTVKDKASDATVASHTFTDETTSVNGKSYVLDAVPGYTVENGVYTVTKASGLKAVADLVNAGEAVSKIVLANNIDLSAYTNWEPIGSITNPYKGSFDGNGHTISGLTINDTEDMDNRQKAWGLFGVIDGGATGVTIENVKVNGTISVSDFGSWSNEEYSNCDGVGGICGRSKGKVTFLACHNDADITITNISFYGGTGGIVGFNPDGDISFVGCINTGKVVAVEDAGINISITGIFGRLYSGTMYMYACYNRAEIKGNGASNAAFISNLSSIHQSNFEACYYEKVNNTPNAMVANSNSIDGCSEVDGTNVTWDEALTAMNNTLTAKGYTGYEFVKNTGTDADAIPLLIQKVEAE